MKNNNDNIKNEILEFLNVFEKDEKYKDIKKYFTTENNFFNLYGCQLYLYIRISTEKQDFGRQILQIYKWLKKKKISVCIDNIYCDKFTGKRLDRKEYQALRKVIQKNDYLLISNLNRLGRGNVNEGYENIKKEWYYYKWQDIKILIFEDELNEYISAPLPFEPKEVTLNRLYMQDLILINEMYKDCLKLLEVSQSTKGGLEKVRLQGVKLGRPKDARTTPENFKKILQFMINK